MSNSTLCAECRDIINNPEMKSTSRLIETKDLGGLIKPSADIYVVVQMCERVFHTNEMLKDDLLFTNILPELSIKAISLISEHAPHIFCEAHFLSNHHRSELIAIICDKYFKMRLRSYCMQKMLIQTVELFSVGPLFSEMNKFICYSMLIYTAE